MISVPVLLMAVALHSGVAISATSVSVPTTAQYPPNPMQGLVPTPVSINGMNASSMTVTGGVNAVLTGIKQGTTTKVTITAVNYGTVLNASSTLLGVSLGSINPSATLGVVEVGTWTVALTTGTIAQVNPASSTTWGLELNGAAPTSANDNVVAQGILIGTNGGNSMTKPLAVAPSNVFTLVIPNVSTSGVPVTAAIGFMNISGGTGAGAAVGSFSGTATGDAVLGSPNALAVRMVEPTDGVAAIYRGNLSFSPSLATIYACGITNQAGSILGPTEGIASSLVFTGVGFNPANNANMMVPFSFTSQLVNGIGGNRYQQQTSSPYQGAGMNASNMTATGSEGSAADVRNVGAAALGTNIGGTVTFSGATLTADSTWAGGNKITIRCNPASGATEFFNVSTVGITDASGANGFPVTHESADVTALAGTIYEGQLVLDNLNIKVGDKLYLWTYSTMKYNIWITQVR